MALSFLHFFRFFAPARNAANPQETKHWNFCPCYNECATNGSHGVCTMNAMNGERHSNKDISQIKS